MPPPKKPKSGPTRVEEFMTPEEIQEMRWRGEQASNVSQTSASSPSPERSLSPGKYTVETSPGRHADDDANDIYHTVAAVLLPPSTQRDLDSKPSTSGLNNSVKNVGERHSETVKRMLTSMKPNQLQKSTPPQPSSQSQPSSTQLNKTIQRKLLESLMLNGSKAGCRTTTETSCCVRKPEIKSENAETVQSSAKLPDINPDMTSRHGLISGQYPEQPRSDSHLVASLQHPGNQMDKLIKQGMDKSFVRQVPQLSSPTTVWKRQVPVTVSPRDHSPNGGLWREAVLPQNLSAKIPERKEMQTDMACDQRPMHNRPCQTDMACDQRPMHNRPCQSSSGEDLHLRRTMDISTTACDQNVRRESIRGQVRSPVIKTETNSLHDELPLALIKKPTPTTETRTSFDHTRPDDTAHARGVGAPGKMPSKEQPSSSSEDFVMDCAKETARAHGVDTPSSSGVGNTNLPPHLKEHLSNLFVAQGITHPYLLQLSLLGNAAGLHQGAVKLPPGVRPSHYANLNPGDNNNLPVLRQYTQLTTSAPHQVAHRGTANNHSDKFLQVPQGAPHEIPSQLQQGRPLAPSDEHQVRCDDRRDDAKDRSMDYNLQASIQADSQRSPSSGDHLAHAQQLLPSLDSATPRLTVAPSTSGQLGPPGAISPDTTSPSDDRKRGRSSSLQDHTKSAAGRKCQICNDVASGFHYGVWSCEGCKAFFKRSLQGPVEYVCPATNNCTIDKHRRKSCQACRLRKCLEMGMSRGNCRKEKSVRTVTKKKKPEPEAQPVAPPMKRAKIKKELGESSACEDSATTSQVGMYLSSVNTDTVPNHPLVDHLLKIDPAPRMSGHDANIPDSEVHLMTSLMKLADRELIDIINWAKSVPGYTELPLDDRIHLLEASWMEILMLGLLRRSIPYQETLVFAPDLVFTKERSMMAQTGPVCIKLLELVRILTDLDLWPEEFVLLRAMILLNADIHPLANLDKLRELQGRISEAFSYTLLNKRRADYRRHTQLLLLLPHIRQAALNGIAHLFEVKHDSAVPMFDLVKEMLEARSVGANIDASELRRSKSNGNGTPEQVVHHCGSAQDDLRQPPTSHPLSSPIGHAPLLTLPPIAQSAPHTPNMEDCRTSLSLSVSLPDMNPTLNTSPHYVTESIMKQVAESAAQLRHTEHSLPETDGHHSFFIDSPGRPVTPTGLISGELYRKHTTAASPMTQLLTSHPLRLGSEEVSVSHSQRTPVTSPVLDVYSLGQSTSSQST